jgi:serine/threonine-protein kinase HipA
MAWEKVAYELARNAGINVSDTTLIQIDGRSVLVIDRFDRNSDGDRIGYLSAMSMLEASDGQQRSYLEISEVIETHSVQVNAELEELWRRIVFSILISNTDDHLRNHGFLHVRGDSWRLSPAFDMNPNPATGLKFLSTSIDGSDGPATIDAAIKVAPYFRLSEDAALTVLSEVKEAVEQWRNVAARIGLGSSEIESMEPAFSQAE